MIEAVASGFPSGSLVRPVFAIAATDDPRVFDVQVSNGNGSARTIVEVELGQDAQGIHDRVINAVCKLTMADISAGAPYRGGISPGSVTVIAKGN